jgi:glycosyltransferase involved in cell wall biosynthesis
MKDQTKASVSVVFSTFNRAESVRETLEAFLELDLEGIEAEFVVVANNCSDSTNEVLLSLKECMPLVILEEPIPGKNKALNTAIASTELSELIVFCDDDITPYKDWLQEIVATSNRTPQTSVFGGQIIPSWPGGRQPPWADNPFLLSMGFSAHDLGEKEIDYPNGSYPFGGNFWIRKSVLRAGHSYSESMGPKGNSRIMGSETSFLKQLDLDGYKARYVPHAIVRHRIKESDLHLPDFYRRAESYGRGRVHIMGVNHHNLLSDQPIVWYARQLLKLVNARFRWVLAIMNTNQDSRVPKLVNAHVELGRISEAFKLAKQFQSP